MKKMEEDNAVIPEVKHCIETAAYLDFRLHKLTWLMIPIGFILIYLFSSVYHGHLYK